MNPLTYDRPTSIAEAIRIVSADPDARFLAGGTNLVDLMKYDVERPLRVVDVTRLPMSRIEALPGGGLRIGALVSNSDLAEDARVSRGYPVLSQALLEGASPQLRNMATTGGNLLQRTRCYYFYDTAFPCNKRAPGSGCSALGGQNRIHAVLGQSDACIAVHPSDMAVALAALDAVVQVQGSRGSRSIPIADFHRLPGDTPHIDTNLQHGELITAVDLPPASALWSRSHYLKVRDRAQYAFALTSAAVAMSVAAGVVQDARIALGGVAHKPWRAVDAERSLRGKPANEQSYRAAAEAALAGAHGYAHNQFKIELAKRTLVRALREVQEA
jgi:xanthine dehydrogenase YagS FAD-binding subunit